MPVSSLELAATKSDVSQHGVPSERSLTVFQTYMHLFKGNVGIGMLSLGFHFSKTGALPGLAIILVVGAQAVYGMLLLLTVQQAAMKTSGRTSERLSFEDVAGIVLGSPGRRLVQMCVLALQLGVCTLIMSFLRTGLGTEFQGSNRYMMLVLVIAACSGLSLLPDLRGLWPVSLGGNIGLVIAALSAILASMYEIMFHNDGITNHASPSLASYVALLAGTFYSIEGISLTLPIGNALEAAQVHRYPEILCKTTVVILVIFTLLGTSVGYAFSAQYMEKASVSSFMSRNYTNVYFAGVDWIVSFSLLATFPLQLVPIVQVLEAAFDLEGYEKKTALRVGLCVACGVAGLLFTKDKLMDIVGALTSTTLAALPYAMHARLNISADPQDRKPLLLAVDVFVIVLCLVVMVLGVCSGLGMLTES